MICCFWRRTCRSAWFHNMRWPILFWLAQEFTRQLFKMHLFVSEEDKVTQTEIRPLHLKQTPVKYCISKHSRSTGLKPNGREDLLFLSELSRVSNNIWNFDLLFQKLGIWTICRRRGFRYYQLSISQYRFS